MRMTTNKTVEEIMDSIQVDLNNGEFIRICGNETVFKKYVEQKLFQALSHLKSIKEKI
jgi:hypothetical protein